MKKAIAVITLLVTVGCAQGNDSPSSVRDELLDPDTAEWFEVTTPDGDTHWCFALRGDSGVYRGRGYAGCV